MTARLAAFLRRQPPALLTLAGLCSIGLLACIDWMAPLDLSFLIFYVGPVLFLVWFVGRGPGSSARRSSPRSGSGSDGVRSLKV